MNTNTTHPQYTYLDNAATTYPKPPTVYQAADDFYRRFGGNAGRGGNPLARACTRLLSETRHQLAAWLKAPTPEQVIFAPSATHALNLAILGADLHPGDTVYASPFEHNSVLRPLEYLHQKQGIHLKEIPFNPHTYACELDKLAATFQIAPPSLVCVTQASNVCGFMPPVLEIAQRAKKANPQAIIIVDGAQTAGLYPLDLKSNLLDAFIFSGHKSLYGPYGIAGLVLASAWRPAPLLFGGTGTQSESIMMPNNLPSIYEAGSHNIWAIAGLNAALTWLQETGKDVIIKHTMDLAEELREALNTMPDIDLLTPPKDSPWCGILSFSIESILPQSIETALGAKNIAVRAGLHCAPWAHRWLKTIDNGGTTRVTPGNFNTSTDIAMFIETVTHLLD